MEMRKAHKRAMEALRREKDQLLDEETKATQSGKQQEKLNKDREYTVVAIQ